MERSPFFIPECDERRRATCKHGPDCEHLQHTQHHLRPRRLLGIAKKQKAEIEYQRKLKRVIHHPFNILEAPRCVHDDLDRHTSDTLPSEAELDRTLEIWTRDE